MKKEKKLRITINKIFNSLRNITIGIILWIIILLIFVIAIGVAIPISSTSIMSYKNAAYEIYNEGLLTSHYDSIKIETPNQSDVDMLVNKGLKYVTYKDLMNIEIEDILCKIEFNKNTFKIYRDMNMNIKYTEIIVDNENVHDISYYEYETGINYKEVLKYIIIILILCLLVCYLATSIDIDVIYVDSDEDEENDVDEEEIETQEVATEDSFEETKETEKEE